MGADTASTTEAVPVLPPDRAGGTASTDAAPPATGTVSAELSKPGKVGEAKALAAAVVAADTSPSAKSAPRSISDGQVATAPTEAADAGPNSEGNTGSVTATDLGALSLQRDSSLLGANTDPHSGSGRLGWIGALSGHLAVFVLIFAAPAPQGYWSGGSDGDGIDVEIVGTLQPTDTDTAVAQADQAESLARTADRAPEPPPSAPVPSEPAHTAVPDPDDIVPEPMPAPEPVVTAEPAPTSAPEPRPKAEPNREVAAPSADADPSKGARDRVAASPTGAQRLGVASSVTLRASPGEISAYSRAITETLDRSKPRTTLGLKGTVSISFAIDDAGVIERAFIDRSSGSPRLDSLALDALKAVRLPPPPQGLTAEQRVYRIPITFQ